MFRNPLILVLALFAALVLGAWQTAQPSRAQTQAAPGQSPAQGAASKGLLSPTPAESATLTPTATGTPGCVSAWQAVDSPNPGRFNNWLLGVSALTANDAWAVGASTSSDGIGEKTLVEHWNGARWEVMNSPSVGNESWLYAVSARAVNDVWAVGWYQGAFFIMHPLIEHWDGRHWSIVPAPDGDSGGNYLYAVSARTADDVWAVGFSYSFYNLTLQTFVLHWNGSRWDLVPSANVGSNNNSLGAVSALAANDVWAVGWYYDDNTQALHTLAEHWDGSQWSVVASLSPGSAYNNLEGVVALAANDVWAVGSSYDTTPPYQTLVEHWDGSQWKVFPSPNVGVLGSELLAIAANATGDLWAAGHYITDDGKQTLVLHGNGISWNVVSSPSPASLTNDLVGMSAASANDVWVVGDSLKGGQSTQTLVERYSSSCATPVPTSTPLVTPTACAVSFTDVPPSSPYYTYVQCLACRGISSGYGDGTFRPNATVTRGQLTKMVVLAAGWATDTTGGPHFSDVPPSNPFYAFVETAYHHQVISGYGDGTFRPSANVTRGQLAKIVATATGFDGVVGFQIFEDVPVGHPFYNYVQLLGARLIMDGYSCGGASEPCNAPYERKYYRPNNTATRGQIAKIISNTFFPDCTSAGP